MIATTARKFMWSRSTLRIIGVAAAALLAALTGASAASAEVPTQFQLVYHVGSDVNKLKVEAGAPQEERNQCAEAALGECQLGVTGGEARAFNFPEGVATSGLTGDVVIADRSNHRIQVLDREGKFLLAFGWNVNPKGGTQKEKDVCTVAAECGPGEAGTGLAGQLGEPVAVTVDPVTGDLYVLDSEYNRLDKYTANGEFLLMVGGRVNENNSNLCTSGEESQCKAGVPGRNEGEFQRIESGYGNVLSVGPGDLLYVADQNRVEKFEASGKSAGTVALPGLLETAETRGIAVDGNGNLFVIDNEATGVHEYSPAGAIQSCVIDAGGETQLLTGVAFDAYGRLGVLGYEHNGNISGAHVQLFETEGTSCGKSVGGEILPPSGQLAYGSAEPRALAFSSFNPGTGVEDRLFVIDSGEFVSELEAYAPGVLPIALTCETTEVLATSGTLCGEVDPNGFETGALFKYWRLKPGTTEVFEAKQTPVLFKGSGTQLEPVHFSATELIPNETYYDEVVAEATVNGKPFRTTGIPVVSFHTKTPAPEIPGTPEALFVGPQSAVMQSVLNPEHASTTSSFEFGVCPSCNETTPLVKCLQVRSIGKQVSEQYGAVAVSTEVTELKPQTQYGFRLVAENESGRTESEKTGCFATPALPSPQAQTGAASAIAATTTTIAGTVDPDGQPATYVFELGVYAGAATSYGIVFSGSAGEGTAFVAESLNLTGLQSATTYAYRIGVRSGYVKEPGGETVGATGTFTTLGLPEVIPPPTELPMLAIPAIKWPVAPKPTPKCKRGYRRNSHGRCVKAKAKHAKRAKRAVSRRRRR